MSAGLDSLRGRQPRRVDDHPAARPRSGCSTEDARPGPAPHGRAQAQGDHPVDPADRGVPGRGRQAADHHRLPQPELLRQPDLRREGGGAGLLRHATCKDLTSAAGGDPRRAAQVAVELRPRAATRSTQCPTRRSPTDADCPASRQLVVPPDDRRSSSGGTRSSTCSPRAAGRRCRATSTRRRLHAPRRTRPVVLAPPGDAAVDRRRTSCGRSATELADKLCGEDARRATRSSTAACAVTTTLDVDLQKIAEKWVKAAAVVPNAKNPQRGRQGARASSSRAVDGEPPQQGPPQRRARRDRLPDRRAHRLRRQRGLLRDRDQARRSSRSSTSSASGYRQPGSAFKPFNYATGIDDKTITAGDDVHGRRHRLRRRLHADRRRQPRARPGPRPQRAPVLAQHPVGQGDGHQRRPTTSSPRPRSSG